MNVHSYHDLLVWQKAMRLAGEGVSAWQAPAQGRGVPSDEPAAACLGALQYRRRQCSRDAEDYARFISIARGSLAETETILLLLVDVELLTNDRVQVALALRAETGRMLNRLLVRLRSTRETRSLIPSP
jgi:hypothetical protein